MYIELDSVNSTNTYAREHFSELCNGCIITAKRQTNGKGRLSRVWVSNGDAIYFTMVQKTSFNEPSPLPLVVALALRQAIIKLYEVAPQIKWPNDILLKGKKVAGILCEGVQGGYIIGIGLNVAQDKAFFKDTQLENASSMYIETGLLVDKKMIIAELTLSLNEKLLLFAQNGFTAFHKEYQKHCINIGKEVFFEGEKVVAAAISELGELVVEASGEQKKVISGEVSLTKG